MSKSLCDATGEQEATQFEIFSYLNALETRILSEIERLICLKDVTKAHEVSSLIYLEDSGALAELTCLYGSNKSICSYDNSFCGELTDLERVVCDA